MKSGKLDRRISLQTAVEAQDAYGQAIRTWSTTYTVWADVFPMKYSEVYEGDRKTEQTLFKMRIRYIAGIIPTMRIEIKSGRIDGSMKRITFNLISG